MIFIDALGVCVVTCRCTESPRGRDRIMAAVVARITLLAVPKGRRNLATVMAESPVSIAVTARLVPQRSWIASSGEVVRNKFNASCAAGRTASVGTSPNTKKPAAKEMPARRTSGYFLLRSTIVACSLKRVILPDSTSQHQLLRYLHNGINGTHLGDPSYRNVFTSGTILYSALLTIPLHPDGSIDSLGEDVTTSL